MFLAGSFRLGVNSMMYRNGRLMTASFGKFCSTSASEKDVLTMKDIRKELILMIERQKEQLELVDRKTLSEMMPTSQSELPLRSMGDSVREGVVPLGTSRKDRLLYLNPYGTVDKPCGTVRFGRLLEDLDTLAVACCYKYNEDPNLPKDKLAIPRAIWTLMVDRIDVNPAFSRVASDRDIRLSGHVSCVGKTCLKTTIEVTQKDSSGVDQKLLEAVFVMAARDPQTKRKAFVNRLIDNNPNDLEINNQRQDRKPEESLLKAVPNEDEISKIHKLFWSTIDPSSSTFKVRHKPAGSKWMDESKLKTFRVCFPEQKNIYNSIFGGFLMRQAFELAWANAFIYSKDRCWIVAVDGIQFLKPVPVGSFLYLSSQIAYTKGHRMQVRVYAEVKNPKNGENDTTNEFHFTLEGVNEKAVSPILPETYAENIIYLDSRRRFKKAMEFRYTKGFA